MIREALHPYPESLHIVTKVGATRDEQGGWPTARRPEDLRAQVHDNLKFLQVDVLDLVDLRLGDAESPQPGSLAEAFETLAELQQQGLIRQLGVSNATAEQVTEAQSVAPIVCVKNMYNLAHHHDDKLVDRLATEDVAYVPFFPLRGLHPAAVLGALGGRRPIADDPDVRRTGLAAAVIAAHEDVTELDAIGR